MIRGAVPPPLPRLAVAIALVSAAVIAYQICLMQILSIVQWHHFASTIIAVALLGFGASGTCIALLRRTLLSRYHLLLPLLMAACGIAMLLAVPMAQNSTIRFDSFLLFAEPGHVYRLAATCVCFFIPFFLAAMAIGLVFVKHVATINRLYCANLIGSAIGAALAVILLQRFAPEAIPAIIAVLPLLAGMITSGHGYSRLALCLVLCLSVWCIYHPPRLTPSQFKDIVRALDLPGATIVSSRNSPMGYLEIVRAPTLRHAPGLSLTFQGDVPIHPIVFRNGDWFGPLIPRDSAAPSVLDYTTGAAAYSLIDPARVLVLDAGSGADVVQGLNHSSMVTAVEPHPLAARMISELCDDGNRLRVHPLGARAFLRQDRSLYDLIVLPMANTFGGSSGIHALQENHLLTIEAVRQMWHRLGTDGMIVVSCWLDTPPRASLKLISTACAALDGLGVDPAGHILALKGWGTFTMLVKRSAIMPADLVNMHEFCERLAFDPLLPTVPAYAKSREYGPRQEGWATIAAQLISNHADARAYDFNISPATDDRPYFSQFLTLRGLARLKKDYGSGMVPFFELGYLILIVTALLISFLACILILLPLMKARPSRPLPTLLYFGGLGAGFLFLEIAFIQHALAYLGAPMYAAAIVIGGILFFSGCGSLSSGMMPQAYRIVPACIAAVILLYVLGFAQLLMLASALPTAARIAVLLIAIAPIAFCMGMPFPLGLSRLPREDVPWAWGVNGCLSVMSAPVASIIAVEWGFSRVMLFAALAYVVAWFGLVRKRYA